MIENRGFDSHSLRHLHDYARRTTIFYDPTRRHATLGIAAASANCSFDCGDANGTCSDRSAGRVVDGEGIDLRSVLGVEELGHPASAAMLASPRANRKEDRQEVAPGFVSRYSSRGGRYK